MSSTKTINHWAMVRAFCGCVCVCFGTYKIFIVEWSYRFHIHLWKRYTTKLQWVISDDCLSNQIRVVVRGEWGERNCLFWIKFLFVLKRSTGLSSLQVNLAVSSWLIIGKKKKKKHDVSVADDKATTILLLPKQFSLGMVHFSQVHQVVVKAAQKDTHHLASSASRLVN